MRAPLAMIAGRTAGKLSRLAGFRATSLPGVVARRIAPNLVRELSGRIGQTVFITGTNGKTTTSHVLAHVLREAGLRVLHNPEGANMLSGVASCLVRRMRLWSSSGTSAKREYDVAVLEIDEASLPIVMREITPDWVIVTNFFRDQLDRYGEIDLVIRRMAEALGDSTTTRLLLNADDPLVCRLRSGGAKPPAYFGLAGGLLDLTDPGSGESVFCPFCERRMAYDHVHYGQLGHYRCECGFQRPAAHYEITELEKTPLGFRLEETDYRSTLGGHYNAYNLLAAVSCARELGILPKRIATALTTYRTAEGRMQTYSYRGTPYVLNLTKNPSGANAVLSDILSRRRAEQLVFILNDRLADGEDISWIWDVDFERLQAGNVRTIICSGTRAQDLAIRLKYAEPKAQRILCIPNPKRAVRRALQAELPTYVLPTYTGLQPVRAYLARRAMIADELGLV